jgi:hypothetical protein
MAALFATERWPRQRARRRTARAGSPSPPERTTLRISADGIGAKCGQPSSRSLLCLLSPLEILLERAEHDGLDRALLL